jgi:HYR domain
MRTWLRGKFTLLFIMLGMMFAFPAIALADNVLDDVVIGGNDTITAGGSTTINYHIVSNGSDGCNVDSSNAGTITINTPAGVSSNKSSLSFTQCGSAASQSVTYTSNVVSATGHLITVSASGGKAANNGWNVNPAEFRLIVNPSPNTAPTLNLPANITAEATSAAGAVVNYTATASDQQDSSVTPTCAPASGSTFALGTTTVNCSVTDSGSLTTTGSFTVTVQDTIDPSASHQLSEPANGNGWHKADFTVTLSGSDSGSGVREIRYTINGGTEQVASGSSTHISVDTEGIKNISYYSVDNAGNESAVGSVTVRLDKTAPEFNCNPASSPTEWLADNFTSDCTASDSGGSDLTSDSPASFQLSTNVAAGNETNTASTGSQSLSDAAGNSVTAGPFIGIKVDKKAPTFGACPTAGPFTQGSTQSVTIIATDGGSGLDNDNTALTRSVDTSNIGATSVTFTAQDNVANSDTKTCTYDVDYNFSGFFQPIDNKDTNGNFIVNKAKLGSTAPVKFSLGGDQGLNIFEAGYPKVSAAVTCAPSSSTDALEEYVTATVSSLKYDSTANQYIYNWKTDPKYTVGTCRQLIVKLADGTEHRATFSFFK